MEAVLQTSNLTKNYGHSKVVNDVSILITRGDIYGLIGQNGAGKTSLMKMVAGLTFPSSGDIFLFRNKNLEENRKKIGVTIENPAVYPNLTAKENLEIACRLFNIEDKSNISHVLSIVGLSDTGNKKARNFSLGMKQRLALAIVLIDRPEFIILDEPINGLDPKGVTELRDLILQLNHEYHITFLISSHVLGELEKIATKYGVLKDGVLVDQFSAQELNDRFKKSIMIETQEIERASDIIIHSLHTQNFIVKGNFIQLYDYIDCAEKVNATLINNGIPIKSFCLSKNNLEDYFLNLMGGKS